MTNLADDSSRPFQYDSLPSSSHIRLLEKQPCDADGILRFSLTARDIDDKSGKPYHCLSYTWGNPFAHGNIFRDDFDKATPQYGESGRVRILINGRQMFVQKNLYDALHTLPDSTYSEYANLPLDGTAGQTYLHIAAGKGRSSGVATWLKAGIDINKLDDHGHTALHYAAGLGHVECVKILLEKSSRIDFRDASGKTALDHAKAEGHLEVVKLLDDMPSITDLSNLSLGQKAPRPSYTTLIWADAICINQNDMQEKGVQVSMMDRIYSTALYVVAWLGPPDHFSKAGIQTLNLLHDHLEKLQNSQIEPFSGKNRHIYEKAGVPYVSFDDWCALASIYQRQWFRRSWIVQEAVLPNSLLVYLGKDTLLWQILGRVADAIRQQEARLGTAMSTTFNPAEDAAIPVIWNTAEVSKWRSFKSQCFGDDDAAKSSRELFTLNNIAYSFWTFGASEPRDKIFAFYGLLNLFATDRIESDYTLSVATAFTNATVTLIKSERNLQVLSSCVYPHLRRSDLPSWVPDYSLGVLNPIPDNFAADKGLKGYLPEYRYDSSASQHVLTVDGIYLGEISEVSGRGSEPGVKLQFDLSWLRLPLSLLGKSGYGDKTCLSAILWNVLCMEMSKESLFDPIRYGSQDAHHQGLAFRQFMLLLILAEGDALIRKHLGLEIKPEPDMIYSHTDYDPMTHDMEHILADLDTFQAHEGKEGWMPSREEVLWHWKDFKTGLLRNESFEDDTSIADVYLPEGVTQDNSRPVGSGYVLLHSRTARKCNAFISPYLSMSGGRHLFTVNGMYLGFGSQAAKPGDEVWILPGLNAPAVLRPASGVGATSGRSSGVEDEKCTRYQFIGSSFISGMMQGEVGELVKDKLEEIELV